MSENLEPICPECAATDPAEILDRRHFIRVVGGGTAALTLGTAAAPQLLADSPKATGKPEKKEKPAEALIKELFAGLSDEQKKQIVHPWDQGGRTPARHGMYNRAYSVPLGKVLTKAQSELANRILRAILNGEEGYKQISRNDTWDSSSDFVNCGCNIFGDPDKGKFAWLFTGHHLTVRCDGDSEEGAAFGGPLYYGHSAAGYSPRNVYFYQTKAALSVYDALSEKQKKLALIERDPGEQAASVRFRKPEERKPGLSYGEMSKDQQTLVETVMRTILSPFRSEDADEVMRIIKTNGGLQKLHLGFFRKPKTEEGKWDYWRIEGPGFVWNYRILDHVHCFVNISSKIS